MNLLFINASSPPPPFKEGQILVQPKPGVTKDRFERVLQGHQGRSLGQIGRLNIHVVSVPPKAEKAIVEALSHNSQIEFAELDLAHQPSETYANDSQSSWHLSKINAPLAWDISKGDSVNIAILDTGVDANHPDLVNKMLPGWNSVSLTTDYSDIYGHGTKVAGAAAASTDNGIGYAGVAWNSKIIPIRISNDSAGGTAYTSDISRGLTWAADNGAHVANISFQISDSATVTSAAQCFWNKGGITLSSAGNSGTLMSQTDNLFIITVAATDGSDNKAGWSNYGNNLDVAAPGVSIAVPTRGGGYGTASGTSFSSPVTAGVVALIKASNPALSNSQIEKILEDSATKVSGSDFDPYYGYGRVDAGAAIQLAMETTPATDNQAPSVSFASAINGSTLQATAVINVNAIDSSGISKVSLYLGNQWIGDDLASPYSFSFDTMTVADGSYSLKAIAQDLNGNTSSVTATVAIKNTVIVDSQSPSVTFMAYLGTELPCSFLKQIYA